MSSPSFIETSSKRCSSARVSATPSSTLLLDVLGRVELRLLRQVADLEARRRPRLAEELLVDAGHDPQQRALAGAVVAEHADLGARVERQPDPLQDLALRRARACADPSSRTCTGRSWARGYTRPSTPRLPSTVAYRDDAGDVLEAPTSEGVLEVELAPRSVKLTDRPAHPARRPSGSPPSSSTTRSTGRRTGARPSRSRGGWSIARDVPHEDLGIWLEVDPSSRPRVGMQRIFGVEPVSLIEPAGLDRPRRPRSARPPAPRRARGARRGRPARRSRSGAASTRCWSPTTATASSSTPAGCSAIARGSRWRSTTTAGSSSPTARPPASSRCGRGSGSPCGATTSDSSDPQGTDLARVSIPWIDPEDRKELARRIGQLVDREHPDAEAWPPRLAAVADPAR